MILTGLFLAVAAAVNGVGVTTPDSLDAGETHWFLDRGAYEDAARNCDRAYTRRVPPQFPSFLFENEVAAHVSVLYDISENGRPENVRMASIRLERASEPLDEGMIRELLRNTERSISRTRFAIGVADENCSVGITYQAS